MKRLPRPKDIPLLEAITSVAFGKPDGLQTFAARFADETNGRWHRQPSLSEFGERLAGWFYSRVVTTADWQKAFKLIVQALADGTLKARGSPNRWTEAVFRASKDAVDIPPGYWVVHRRWVHFSWEGQGVGLGLTADTMPSGDLTAWLDQQADLPAASALSGWHGVELDRRCFIKFCRSKGLRACEGGLQTDKANSERRTNVGDPKRKWAREAKSLDPDLTWTGLLEKVSTLYNISPQGARKVLAPIRNELFPENHRNPRDVG